MKSTILSLLFLLLFQSLTIAQLNVDSLKKENAAFKLKNDTTELSTVEIIADRPVTAASASYLNQLDFANRPKNSAQDMLRLVPGLFIAQHAGGGKAEQIFIRGFDCDHGTDVATYVDGMPVNMPSHGHGQGYEDLHFLIPEVVKGMEVFKGPYSPKFGDFATGAAVQFTTLDSLEHSSFQTETAYSPHFSAFTSHRDLIQLKLPDYKDKITSYVAVDLINNRSYFVSDQHFKRFSLFGKTIIQLSSSEILSVSMGGFNSSWDASGQIPERAVAEGIISRFGSLDNTEGGFTQRKNVNLNYSKNENGKKLLFQAFASDYTFKLFSDFTFFLYDPVHGDQIEQDDNRRIYGMNCSYSVPHIIGNMHNQFSVGTSFRMDDIHTQLWHTEKRVRLQNNINTLVREQSFGLFLNEVLRFSDHFRIEAGVRIDHLQFHVQDVNSVDASHLNISGYNYQFLLSPKLNSIYTVNNDLQFFFNAGTGFHSNDARSVIQEKSNHQLPRAFGSEIGLLIHLTPSTVVSAALWGMDVENELVYVGDEGTTENHGPSRRIGVDLSIRKQISKRIFLDVDINTAQCNYIDKVFGKKLQNENHLPFAPLFTSSGGVLVKLKHHIDCGLRYRYMSARPANESNTVQTRAYSVVDLTTNYQLKHIRIGLVIENLFNVNWNEAQFDTTSRLQNETMAHDELHFTPGTPFTAKLILAYQF